MFCGLTLMPFSKHVHTTHWEGGNMIKKNERLRIDKEERFMVLFSSTS